MPRLALIILDGFGINENLPEENAIRLAHTPTFDTLFKSPYAGLEASGKAVWVPEGQMGNSEIGHLTIGSGRILRQSLVKISDMLSDRSFAEIPAYKNAIKHCEDNGSVLHLFSLFGPGGVHASDDHLRGILEIIPAYIPVRIHLFTDGRDLAPTCAHELMEEFERFVSRFPNVAIASIWGRYYWMDRDNNWARIQKAYNVMTIGWEITDFSPSDYIKFEYSVGHTDEFIEPVSFSNDATYCVQSKDAVIHMNFRSDRAIQMTKAFIEPEKTWLNFGNDSMDFGIDVKKNKQTVFYVAMTRYYPGMPCDALVEDDSLANTLWEVLSNNWLSQLRLAETEKFAHVTKFFDWGKNIELPGKKEILIPSHKVATYDLDPEMSASEICDTFLAEANNFDVTIVNFANGDMVGHTGSLTAAKKAVETLDKIMEKIIAFCGTNGIELLVTADHGNCEEMGTEDEPKTQHSLNVVPCWHIYEGEVQPIAEHGWLADLAPTCLHILELPIPEEMTGKVLTK